MIGRKDMTGISPITKLESLTGSEIRQAHLKGIQDTSKAGQHCQNIQNVRTSSSSQASTSILPIGKLEDEVRSCSWCLVCV